MYTVFPNLIHYDFDYPFYKMSKDPNFIVVKNASKELINAFKTLQAYIRQKKKVTVPKSYMHGPESTSCRLFESLIHIT